MTPDQLVEAIREEFLKQLTTAGYTKAGIQIAFERAIANAMMRFQDWGVRT